MRGYNEIERENNRLEYKVVQFREEKKWAWPKSFMAWNHLECVSAWYKVVLTSGDEAELGVEEDVDSEGGGALGL